LAYRLGQRGSAFGGLLMATALLGNCGMHAAVLLVVQACKSGVALLVSQSSVIDPEKEEAAAAEEVKALVEGSSLLLAGAGGVLVEELLAAGSLVPLVSLIGDGLCLRGSRLSTLLHRLQRTRAAFLRVLHAGKCDLTLQSLRGLASEPGKEASAAEP